MSFHPSLDRKAIRRDLDWVWAHTVPGQLTNLAGTYQDFKSGDYGSARERSSAGIRIGLENLAIGLTLGAGIAGGGIHAYRALGVGKRIVKINKGLAPQIFKAHILWEIYERDLEWQDIPYFASPWVAKFAWDRYIKKNQWSSPAARRGNAVGPGGGTKKKSSSRKTSTTDRYFIPELNRYVDKRGRRLPAKRGRCGKFMGRSHAGGQRVRIRRYYCVLKKGHRGPHRSK